MCVKGVEHRGAPGVVWGWSNWGEVCVWGWSNGGEVYKCIGVVYRRATVYWLFLSARRCPQWHTACCQPRCSTRARLRGWWVHPQCPGPSVCFYHTYTDHTQTDTAQLYDSIQIQSLQTCLFMHVYKMFFVWRKKKGMVLHPPGRMVLVPSQESFQ